MHKRVVVLVGFAVAVVCSVASAGEKDDMGGSNVGGKEVVCRLEGTEAESLDALSRCRRGDILALGRITLSGVMAYCDFTKTILYRLDGVHTGACVYTGAARPNEKR